MTTVMLLAGWLVVVWVALWGELSVANVLTGLVVVGVVLALFPPERGVRMAMPRPIAGVRLLALFLWKLVEASVVLAWEVLTPHNRVNEGIVAIRLHGYSDAVTTVVANMISLVPGTVTLEAEQEPTVLYVHALHLGDPDVIRQEVQHYELLVARAMGRVTSAVTDPGREGEHR